MWGGGGGGLLGPGIMPLLHLKQEPFMNETLFSVSSCSLCLHWEHVETMLTGFV